MKLSELSPLRTPAPPTRAQTTRVLLVDDEHEFRHSTAELLRHAGLECTEASNASEGAAHLERGAFDVLVADINMPGNRDLEFLRRCRADHPHLPVLLVTGYPSIGTAVGALRLAAVDYLIKPTEFDVLLGRIDRAAARGRELRRSAWLERQLPEVLAALDRLGVPLAPGEMDQMSAGGMPLLDRFTAGGSGVVRPPSATHSPGAAEARRSSQDPVARERAALAAGASDPDLAARLDDLSKRELEVLRAVLSGERPAVIARRLFISPTTVRNHLKAIFRKTGVHSQIDLVLSFRRPSA